MTQQELVLSAEFFLRILTAAVCGIVIGYERENRNKEAGIRTHAIVALGAALIMIVSKYGFSDIQNYDASRVAAQIVSGIGSTNGIGFLGAGIIFIRNRAVSGLTTAAGIWATAGVGMAVGSGMYYIGIAVTVLIVLMQFVLHRQFVIKKEHRYEKLVIIMKDHPGIEELQEKLLGQKVEVDSLELEMTENQEYRMELGVFLPKEYNKMELTKILMDCSGVTYVRC